jgi:hypothetical protein
MLCYMIHDLHILEVFGLSMSYGLISTLHKNKFVHIVSFMSVYVYSKSGFLVQEWILG